MNVVLFYPPASDDSMPHSAPATLKAATERAFSDVRTTCVDLNHQFIRDVFGPAYDEELRHYREKMAGDETDAAIRAAWRFRSFAARRCQAWDERNPGHRLVFGSDGFYTPPGAPSVTAEDPTPALEFAYGTSPFDALFRDALDKLDSPDVIGVSFMVAHQILPLLRLSALARERWPAARIVWGGSLMTALYRALARGPFDALFDFLVLKEGESAFVSVLGELRGGARAGSLKVVRSGGPRPELSDVLELRGEAPQPISALPWPDFSDYDLHDYVSPVALLPILTSRRCYWGRCAFCDIHQSWDPTHRRREIGDIVDELTYRAETQGVRHFVFIDESCPPDHLSRICDEIIERGLEIRFEFASILEKRFLDEGLIRRVARAGGRSAFWGLEAVDARTLCSMNKRINRPEDYAEFFRLLAAEGIHNLVFTLSGYPLGAPDRDELTAAYLRKEKNVHAGKFFRFAPTPLSPLALTPRETPPAWLDEGEPDAVAWQAPEFEWRESFSTAARQAMAQVILERPDLAFSSLMNHEERFAFASFHGPDYARNVDLEALIGHDALFETVRGEASIHAPILNEQVDPRNDAKKPTHDDGHHQRDAEEPPSEPHTPAPAPRLTREERALRERAEALSAAVEQFLALPGTPFADWKASELVPAATELASGLRFELHRSGRQIVASLLPRVDGQRGLFEGRALVLTHTDAASIHGPEEVEGLRTLGAILDSCLLSPDAPSATMVAKIAAERGWRAPASARSQESLLARNATLVRRIAERIGGAPNSPLPGWKLVAFEKRTDQDGFSLDLSLARGERRLDISLVPSDADRPALATTKFVKLICARETPPDGPAEVRSLERLCKLVAHYLKRAN